MSHVIAILDCVDDMGRGAQLCAPTRRILHPIEKRYQTSTPIADNIKSPVIAF
ncbi:hypothetical protein H6G17_03330 [Chroococcidiopsis sp. FACHB-1243]|uniref:hypothetical protein n=1 Tax=Chroococcidiopsis sp. [FACHB-1243] TaxID=2692781 RepID=UPI00177AE50B|nr:hypothetical protein [Chroococcidiopsis sp. [FACHB-1243]]MBD2304551.1 hypothetical protein [Chroococcidiopsis sp. [FACHB-1243]]